MARLNDHCILFNVHVSNQIITSSTRTSILPSPPFQSHIYIISLYSHFPSITTHQASTNNEFISPIFLHPPLLHNSLSNLSSLLPKRILNPRMDFPKYPSSTMGQLPQLHRLPAWHKIRWSSKSQEVLQQLWLHP